MPVSSTNDVTITIDGPVATIDPRRADLVAGLLAYDQTACQAGGPPGYRLAWRRGALYDRDAEGRLVVMTGHVQRLVEALEAGGRCVEVKNRTAHDERLVPDRRQIDGAGEKERVYLDAVAAHHRGQVVFRNDRQLVRLIELARRVYPRARTLVVCKNRRRVRFLMRQLRHRLRGEVSASAGHGFDPDARVLIITTQQFQPAMSDPDVFGLLLLVEADRVVDAAVSRQAIGLVGHRRVYGFVQANLRLGQRERLELEGVCGPVLYTAPGPRGPTAAVKVVLAEPPWTPVPPADDALEHKRRAIWHNRLRNEVVAGLVTALAAGRDDDLRDKGLIHPDARLPVPAVTSRRVVVLVESSEHGLALTEYLPGWKFFTAPTAAAGERLPESGLPATCIITLVAATTLRHLPADVLVRAGGGRGPLDLPGFPPGSVDGRREVVVVDLAGDGDGSAEGDTRARLKNYARMGWAISAPTRWLYPPEEEVETPHAGRRRRR
jgi:hypothetical protein